MIVGGISLVNTDGSVSIFYVNLLSNVVPIHALTDNLSITYLFLVQSVLLLMIKADELS